MKRELFDRAMVAVAALAAAFFLGYPAPAEDPGGSPMTIIPDYHKLAREAASAAELFAILDTYANDYIGRTEWQFGRWRSSTCAIATTTCSLRRMNYPD